MGRAALVAVASLAAILIQLTVLNGLPLPGGAAPDLVLILVVAVALTGGPAEGMLTGFFAGLALDIAPPASHLVGQSALVFCLAGYAAGRLGGILGRTTWLPLGAVALCTAGGEALSAMVGMLFGDPGVTWSALGHVLPISLGYDLLVCPFALYAAMALSGWAPGGALARGGARPGPARAVPAPAAGAIRDTGTGRSPRLRAAAGRPRDGWIGGAGQRPGRAAAVFAARPLHLRLRGGQAGSARSGAIPRTLAARPVHMRFGHGRSGSVGGGSVSGGSARGGWARGGWARGRPAARVRPVRPVHLRLGGSARRRDGAVGSSMFGGRGLRGWAPGRGVLRGRAPRGSALRRSGPGGSSLTGGGTSLRNGSWSAGSGKGARPRFRRQPGRGMALRGRARRGGLGAGLLRRGRGRAMFGRRSTVWRIGSKRTGGLS